MNQLRIDLLFISWEYIGRIWHFLFLEQIQAMISWMEIWHTHSIVLIISTPQAQAQASMPSFEIVEPREETLVRAVAEWADVDNPSEKPTPLQRWPRPIRRILYR